MLETFVKCLFLRVNYEYKTSMRAGKHVFGVAAQDAKSLLLGNLVGPPRFELGTSSTPRKRATRLRYGPIQESFYRISACEADLPRDRAGWHIGGSRPQVPASRSSCGLEPKQSGSIFKAGVR